MPHRSRPLKPEGPSGIHGDQEVLWGRLRANLRRFVGASLRHSQETEEIVADVIAAAWKRFGLAATWQDVWSWATNVARRLTTRFFRALGRRKVEGIATPDDLPSPRWRDAVEEVDACDLGDFIMARSSRGDGRTLLLVWSGATSNAEIAAVCHISMRAVQKSRQRLQRAARDTMECLPTSSFSRPCGNSVAERTKREG
jgi:DNA-directed RNA polymerase specialized sigma24 family protein